MTESNVNVVSNIYIRRPESFTDGIDNIQKDPKFVSQITGHNALKIIKTQYGSAMSGVHLSAVQESEYNGSLSCTYSAKGETSHGKVRINGEISYECRCEAINCKNRNDCSPKNYNRTPISMVKDVLNNRNCSLEWLDIPEEYDIFNMVNDNNANSADDNQKDKNISNEELTTLKSEFDLIDSTKAIEAIIESEIDSHIIVNAGPGSGKTYTAIQRLLYILNIINPEECDRILVLCYTRAAVAEIKERIDNGIVKGELPYEANQVAICTFDSFATNYLIAIETPTEELNNLDYNKRIQLFNKSIDSEYFEDFKYCIIDELQDLVNDRAIMTIEILKALKCGYLLLGDKCQAIYDYDCNSTTSINSTKFYQLINDNFSSILKKYEISGNKRQTEKLNAQTKILREQLLNFNALSIAEIFSNSLKGISECERYAEDFDIKSTTGTSAILCRNNGEAEYLSWLLHKNNVPHNLIRTTGQTYSINRCIADALWDYSKDIISDDDFQRRICVRSNVNEYQSTIIYRTICDFLYDEYRDYIDCPTFAKKLCQAVDFPKEIVNVPDSSLIISTIHKAKGREFNKVYLLGYDYNTNIDERNTDTEEERVLYVAQTRPKSEIEILKKKNIYDWFFKKNYNNRWIRTKRKPYTSYAHCVGYATGMNEDIDYSSFVNGDFKNAVKRQAYISENINCGDKVVLKLDGDVYCIVHNTTVVGKMSLSYSQNLMDRFSDGWIYAYHLPLQINELFVKNIITYVSYKDYDNIPQKFRKNRFWLAIELTGFGKILWTENS